MQKLISTILKQLLLITFVITTNILQAQFSNFGFESWVMDSGYEKPTDWGITFYNDSFSQPQANVTKTTDSKTGNYAIRLESKMNEFAGAMSKGNPPIIDANEGFAISIRPSSLQFYYKFLFGGNDTASVFVFLYKNSSVIGLGQGYITDDVASYTLAQVNIMYFSTEEPNKAVIVLKVGNENNSQYVLGGSVLYIDDLVLVGSTAVNDLTYKSASVLVYPNPAVNEITFETSLSDSQNGEIYIYDMTGKLVTEIPIANGITKIQTDTYSSGMYFFRFLDKKNKVTTGRFNIVK